MRVHINLNKSRVSPDVRNSSAARAQEIVDRLYSGKEALTGWVDWPHAIPEELLKKIEGKAKELKKKCRLLVVIGIGGSYLGTAAVLEAMGGSRPGYPQIVFAGHNLSGACQSQVVDKVDENDTYLCVISKSGSTMETTIAFSILKEKLIAKYGREEAVKRIIVITDAKKGALRAETEQQGYDSFEIPESIGGRYSVLTATSLFPLAVAGIRIRKLLEGAREIANPEYWKEEGIGYALTRYELLKRGRDLEIFEYYNPSLHYFGEWTKQLFAESEGKEGRGLFPVSLTLSTDLHSIGQYLQDGRQIFFETVINIKKWQDDIIIPESIGNGLAGKSLNEVNQSAVEGVIAAHSKSDIPIIQITVDNSNEQCLGQLIYFCEMTAAVTGMLLKVDPFTQDGVEKYKAEIKKILKI